MNTDKMQSLKSFATEHRDDKTRMADYAQQSSVRIFAPVEFVSSRFLESGKLIRPKWPDRQQDR